MEGNPRTYALRATASRVGGAVLGALVVAALLVACSANTLRAPSRPASAASSTARTSSSGVSTSGTPPSGPAASSSAPPVVAGCPSGAITASAAPFCFTLPTGFQDSSARPDYAYGWRWRTLVTAGPHDLVEVLAQPVHTELAKLSDAAALRFVEQLRLRADALHVVSAGALTPATVAGARAFTQDATYRLDPAAPSTPAAPSSMPAPSSPAPSSAASAGPTSTSPSSTSPATTGATVAVHNVIVLASGAVVQISCQSTAARAALVAAACAGVQRSLHIA